MINTNLDNSINELKECSIEMIVKCERMIKLAIESMLEKDLEKAKRVKRKDYEINKLREVIRDKSIELIALKQPMARDLRYVHSLSVVANELERIGDYATNIADETIQIIDEEYSELKNISKMYIICSEMLISLKDALNNEDTTLSREIAKRDDEVDALYKQTRLDCVRLMNEKDDYINQGIQFLFVARHLERIGDHITNICEKIVFVVEGEVVNIG
ncbi:MAG: phosphate signaling complex protein PhoU [Peptostreptococcaceae bacterium]